MTNDYRAPEQAWTWEGNLPPVGTEYEVDERRWNSETKQELWKRIRYRVDHRQSHAGKASVIFVPVSHQPLDSVPCPRCYGHGVLVRELA